MYSFVSNTGKGPQKGEEKPELEPQGPDPYPEPFLLPCTASSSQGHPCFTTDQTLGNDCRGLQAETGHSGATPHLFPTKIKKEHHYDLQ